MNKHTPGPWRLKQWQDCTLAIETCDGKFNICTMSDDDDGGFLPDARLIAAAPDLLAALKAVVSMVEAYHEVPPTRAQQARAAIAKAEKGD